MPTVLPEEPIDYRTSSVWLTVDIFERSWPWAERVWIKSQEVIYIGYLWTLKWSGLSTLLHLACEEDSRPGLGLLWFKGQVFAIQVKVVTFEPEVTICTMPDRVQTSEVMKLVMKGSLIWEGIGR